MIRWTSYCSLALIITFLTSPILAADPNLTGFEKSLATWKVLKAKCGGNYSYKIRWSSFVGFGHETEIVCRRNKVVERKYREWKRGPQPVRPGVVSRPQGTGWIETGDKIGSHKKGVPAKTLDQLYQEARKVLGTKLTAHQRLYVRYDKQGLLQSCFWVDTRIADDAPRTGVMISSLTLGKPGQGGRAVSASGGKAINLKIGDSGKTVKAALGDIVLIRGHWGQPLK